jgi:hypothetical protein
MSDMFLILIVPVLIATFAGIAYLVESRGRCHHKWTRWDDPENTGVNVIQRRACEKCNLQESRVMIANASIQNCEEDHVAVPNEGQPAQALDQEARA